MTQHFGQTPVEGDRILFSGASLIAGGLESDSCEAIARLVGQSEAEHERPGDALSALDYGEMPLDRWVPSKRDRRWMGPAMLAACSAAGEALGRAGLIDEPSFLASTDVLVAFRPTDRDDAADAEIVATVSAPDDFDGLISTLQHRLRPSLLLAQVPNMVAANIAMIHGVTGTSLTFLGNAAAGANALRVAAQRIRSGRSKRCLVGATFHGAQRYLSQVIDGSAVGSVQGRVGSAAAFFVLESEKAAHDRGRRPRVALEMQSHRLDDPTSRDGCEDQWRQTLVGTAPWPVVMIADRGADQRQERLVADYDVTPSPLALNEHFGAVFEASIPVALVVAHRLIENAEPGNHIGVVGWDADGGDFMARLGVSDAG